MLVAALAWGLAATAAAQPAQCAGAAAAGEAGHALPGVGRQPDARAGHIGSNDQVAYWFEDVKKNTTFSKTVHLKDGEAMQVSLDKSMLGCFFICR